MGVYVKETYQKSLWVHHAKLVTAWIEEHKDKIAIFYLPPYSPEFNPDEYLNQD